ncbi:MAG TPA: T9SS type A sorting domain-containing protein [Ignavibacteria bacterium]|nr:T9SS type A sorting domain-containing protein [Ignavibacteria bacterium]
MKNLLFLLLISIGILQFLISQPQWQRTIGGSNHDQANCIINTNDGGYAIAGLTFSYAAGYEDIYVVKLTTSGSILWTKTIGTSEVDIAKSILQTSDGGYAIAADIYNNGTTSADLFIIRMDAAGTILWTRTINRAAYDYSCAIIQTNDGGFVIGGMSATGGVFSGDMYVVKLSSAGTYQWSKTYGGTHDEVAYTIIKTTDGGLAFAGYSNSFGPYNLFNFIKTDSDGNIQWNRLIGETGTGSHIYSIKQTTDGGYILAGEQTPTGTGNYDMYIVKLNSSGTIEWTRTVIGTGYDMANSVFQTIDGSYILSGYTNSYGSGGNDMFIVKLNNSGVLQWSKTVGSTGDDQAISVIDANDGGFIATGYTTSFGNGGKDIFIAKFDALGNTCGNTTSPSVTTGTSGTATSPVFTVVIQNPVVTTLTPTIGSGGILTTICSTAPPLQPNLFSPPNNSFNQLSSVRFIWNKSTGAQTYRLQVSQDSLFSSLVLNDSTLVDSTIVVTNLTTNKYYWWRVNAKNAFGTSPYSSVWKFGTFLVGLNQVEIKVPAKYKLYNNYPNPFNPSTIIRFDIPVPGKVNFTVYNIIGKEIYGFDENNLSPGTYEYQFVCPGCPSGTYFCRLSSGNFSETRKMILIK